MITTSHVLANKLKNYSDCVGRFPLDCVVRSVGYIAMIDTKDTLGCAILDPKYYFDVEGYSLKLFNELVQLQRKANFNCYTKVDFLKDKKVEHWCKLEKYIWRSLGFKIKDIRAYRDREYEDYLRCIR